MYYSPDMKDLRSYLTGSGWWTISLLVLIHLANYWWRFTTYKSLTHLIDGLGTTVMETPMLQLGSFLGQLMIIHTIGTVVRYCMQTTVTRRLNAIFTDLINSMLYYHMESYHLIGRERLQELWHYLHDLEHLVYNMVMQIPTAFIYLLYYSYTIYKFSFQTFFVIGAINVTTVYLMMKWQDYQLTISKRRYKADLETKGKYTDIVNNISHIKTSNMEKWEIDRVTQSYNEFHRLRDTDRRIETIADTISHSIHDVIIIAMYVLGSSFVLSKEMSSLDLLYLAVHTGNFFHQIMDIREHWLNYCKMQPRLSHLFGMLNQNTEDLYDGKPLGFVEDIEFNEVSFSYGSKPVLKDVSFRFKTNEVSLLLGPNGSGKSTAIKLLLRLYDWNKGEIRLNGDNITEYRIADIRNQIGFIHQDPPLFNDTLEYNLTYGVPEDKKEGRLRKVCERLRINEWVQQHLQDVVKPRGTSISGGEKKRIQIANALMRDYSVLVMDEPTNALDKGTVNWFMDIVQDFSLWEGKTVVIITHDNRLVSVAQHVVELEDAPES